MAARTSVKRSKGTAKKSKTSAKKTAKKTTTKTAKKATKKAAGKAAGKPAKPGPKKTTTRKAAKTGAKKATSRKAASKKASAKTTRKPAPTGTGELVHTRLLGVAKRLLGPTTTAGGASASGGISHTNPARSAMLKRLLG